MSAARTGRSPRRGAPGGLRGARPGPAGGTTAPQPAQPRCSGPRSPPPSPRGLSGSSCPRFNLKDTWRQRCRPSSWAPAAPLPRQPPPLSASSGPSCPPRGPPGARAAPARPGGARPLSLTCQSQLDGPVPPGPLVGHVPGRSAGSALPCPGLPLPLGPGRETGGGEALMESGWALRAAAAAGGGGEARMCPASP